jgi:UDP-N-acetylglucosamine enolpyruvyl transferase
MDKFIINGPCKVKNQVTVSGSKNEALPALAATLLFDEPVELRNVPNVRDTRTFFDLLRSLNKKVIVSKNKKNVKIYNSKKKISTFCSYGIVKQIRASILALPGLISKHRKAVISAPGGCAIGTRPINYHLNGLKKLGMKYVLKKGYIHATAKQGLKANDVTFKNISVGATESLIIASTLCRGTVYIRRAACEPEVKGLCAMLNSAGAKIKWIGKRTIKIEGVKKLNRTTYTLMGDRIETISWAVLTVLTGGK